jgi:drug/metabolite transporter (DMT)-like permease
VAHQKTPGWYGLLALVAIIISALVFLTTGDIISTSVVLIAALFFAIYAARQPRQLQYQLGDSGVTIGEKYYGFEEFRSFALVPEGAFSSIVFMPMKRFAPLRTIYYAPADEHRIVERLIDCLPFEEHQGDMVDGLMRRIRF